MIDFIVGLAVLVFQVVFPVYVLVPLGDKVRKWHYEKKLLKIGQIIFEGNCKYIILKNEVKMFDSVYVDEIIFKYYVLCLENQHRMVLWYVNDSKLLVWTEHDAEHINL